MRSVNDHNDRNAMAQLVAQDERLQVADNRFDHKLTAWAHPNRSQTHGVMPGCTAGRGRPASYFGPLVIRTFDCGGNGQAAKDRQLAAGSPHLAAQELFRTASPSGVRFGAGTHTPATGWRVAALNPVSVLQRGMAGRVASRPSTSSMQVLGSIPLRLSSGRNWVRPRAKKRRPFSRSPRIAY